MSLRNQLTKNNWIQKYQKKDRSVYCSLNFLDKKHTELTIFKLLQNHIID